jgi:hypothetical protein
MSNGYIKLGPFPNVWVLYEANTGTPEEMWERADASLKEFLGIVAPRYINYAFKTDQYLNSLTVEEGANRVGRIQFFNAADKRFRFHNFRIREVRTKGDRSIKTTKVAQAVKTFDRYFFSVSPAEVIASDMQEMRRCTLHATTLRSRLISRVTETIKDASTYVIDNWESIGGAMVAAGVLHPTKMEEIQQLKGEAATTTKLADTYNANVGYNVLRNGEYYYVNDRRTQLTERYERDALPDNIKRGVGLLKMVPDDTFIEGVGVRRRDYSFYVLGEEQ